MSVDGSEVLSDATVAARASETRPPFTLSTVCLRAHDFRTALGIATDLGFDSVDLVGLRGLCEHVPVNGTVAELRGAAQTFVESGLRGASVNADPGSFDGVDDADEVMRRISRLLVFLEETGVPLLVLPAGEKTEHAAARPDVRRMADALNTVSATARAAGIRVAVEAPYSGRPIDSLSRTADLLAELDPAVELAFDVSHVAGGGESVEGAWDALSGRIGIVHLRDAAPGDIRRVIGHGDVDFGALFRRMHETEYAGDVVLELETRHSPFATKQDEVNAAVAHLQAIRATVRAGREADR
jgi:sugar phosphate isomerase/epimerase